MGWYVIALFSFCIFRIFDLLRMFGILRIMEINKSCSGMALKSKIAGFLLKLLGVESSACASIKEIGEVYYEDVPHKYVYILTQRSFLNH